MAKQIPFCSRISNLFQPRNTVPAGAEVKNNDMFSKSFKLMIDGGVIAPCQSGFFYLLPIAIRSLEKLSRLIEGQMTSIGAQKISCPIMTNSGLWKKTDRLAAIGSELFQLRDRHNKDFILSPTHEESVTQLVASLPALSHKQLPLLLYQITSKFRDEMKPRYGLIRTREFLMKDLYSFDTCEQTALSTYKKVSEAYNEIFEKIGVNFIKVKGVAGVMGGQICHEFHYPADIGDDTLFLCNGCNHSWNKDTGETGPCLQCGSDNISKTKGIEVGHTFLLNTRYSLPLKAQYTTPEGKKTSLVMGSYGLGLTRILAASIEVLSLPDQIRWPPSLAPYSLIIITPKEGSKESFKTGDLPEKLYWNLQESPELKDDVIIDDRSHLTIGKRLQEARQFGYPYVAVVGKAAAETTPLIELLNTNTGQTSHHSMTDLASAVLNYTHNHRISSVQ